MGCDGGSIPTRCELVKVKKKTERADPLQMNRFRWTLCALSKEPLKSPVVCCPLGNLFNKEAVITHLLQKTMPEAFSYIKSLKDLIPVNFAPNPLSDTMVAVQDGGQEAPAQFVCPVTGVEVNGRYAFSLLRSCGCVLSERALREVPSTECLQCHKPFQPADVLPLNPTPEQALPLLAALTAKRKTERDGRKKEKSEKKDKKRKAVAIEKTEEQKEELKVKAASVDGKANGKAVLKKETKRPRAALPAASQPSADLKITPAVYSSIFLPTGQRNYAASFTHYG